MIEFLDKSIRIVEGVESVWVYHLAKDKKALCGKQGIMETKIPLNTWGMKSHIGEKYCRKCEDIARNL